MADDRFCFIHERYTLHSLLNDDDDDDDMLDWQLPDDDISVPHHLLPPFQDEQDESLLPSQTHPSYPYGNPYQPSLVVGPSSSNLEPNLSHRPHRTRTTNHPSSSWSSSSTHAAALSTRLTSLELPHLFSLTTFGEPDERTWFESALTGVVGPKTRSEHLEDEHERDRSVNTHGDAGPPAGQNAADGADDETEEDEEGEDGDEDDQDDNDEAERGRRENEDDATIATGTNDTRDRRRE